MSTRYVVPSRIRWTGPAPAGERDRIERVVLSAIRQAIADAGRGSGTVVVGDPELPPRTGERFSSERRRRGGQGYAVPSYDKGGELEEVPVDDTPIDADSIGTSEGDTIYRSGFGSLPIIRLAGGGGDFLDSHEGAYVETKSLARAFQWGRHLFGGTGFAVLEPRGGLGRKGFVVVGFKDVVTLHGLGGWGSETAKTEVDTAAEVKYTGRGGEFMPLADWTVVAAITSDKVPIVSLEHGAYWSPRLVELALGKAVLDPEDIRAATRMLLGTGAAEGRDKAAREQIARMDRAVFALMPWEQRARYLKLLIEGYTGEQQGKAIVEIFAATTKATELDAIFGLLRDWELDRKVFNDLSPGTAFELLQVLGELRAEGPIDARFFLALLGEMQGISWSEPQRAAQGMLDWILSNVEGIYFMLSHPDEVIKAIPALFQFADLIARAERLEPQALATVAQMVAQVGTALVKAVRGAAYVEQLGRKYSEREKAGADVAGDLIGRVRWALVVEVLSWFVGLGELKAVVASVRSGEAAEKILAILGRLGRFVRGFRAVEAAAEAARLERTLVALGAIAELGEEARAARLVEHLADRQLESLARIAEHANLPEGAGAEALKLALKSDQALARQADSLASALKMLGKFEEKLGGKIGPEAAAGLRRMMESAPWSFEQGMRLAERLPAENAEEFLRALRNVEPIHFRRWGVEGFETIAQRPAAIRFLGEAGSEVFESTFARTGQTWESYERFLEGVELYKSELGNPADYQRFLDRLAKNDASAFEHALGARVRSIATKGGSPEAASLLSRAVGDSGEALAKLSPEARKAAQVAADVSPELTRRIVGAEIEPQLTRALEELDAALRNAEMAGEDVEKTLAALKQLNGEHRALRGQEEIAAMLERLASLEDPKALQETVKHRAVELEQRAAELEKAGNAERARQLRQAADKLRDLAKSKGGQLTDVAALRAEAAKSVSLSRRLQAGGDETLRRLWVQYWSRGRKPKVDFEEYVEILSRHFRGNLGEHEVAFRLGDTHIFLKAPDRLVTLPGTDLVAIDRLTGEVLLIDNKAFLSSEIDKVNALTRNLPKNLEMDLKEFAKLAGDEKVPGELQGAVQKLQKARDDIASKYGHLTPKQLEDPLVQKDIDDILRSNGIKRVVTNAAGEVKGLSNELLAIGIELMDLNL